MYIYTYIYIYIHIYTYIYIPKIYIYITKGRPHLTFVQVLVKDLAYAGLNTNNWAVLPADRRAWRRTLNNLGTKWAKLMAAVCASAATADQSEASFSAKLT